MIQAIVDTTTATASSAFGLAPSSHAILLWAPLLGILFGLAVWLVVLIALQRRRPARVRSTRPANVALIRYRFDDPQTQP